MQADSPSHPGEALFVSHLTRIERIIAAVCARTPYLADRDDFASFVKLKLIEDDYAVLRKFEGRSSLDTYLSVVIQRLLLDYRNSLWGKYRPSTEAKRSGGPAVLLEQLLVRDGHTYEEACEILLTNHDVRMTRSEIDRLAARLPVRVGRRVENEDTLADLPSPLPGADAAVAEQERRQLADRLSSVLQQLFAALDMQDRLILRMRFEDGRTVAEISSLLLLDQKRLYRRIDGLLLELRKGLENVGIAAPAVMELLESPSVTIEWDRLAVRETAVARPSISEEARQ